MRKNYSIEAIITLAALTAWSPVSFGDGPDGLNRRNSGYSLDGYVQMLRHTGRGIVKLPGGRVLLLGGEDEQGTLFNDNYAFSSMARITPTSRGLSPLQPADRAYMQAMKTLRDNLEEMKQLRDKLDSLSILQFMDSSYSDEYNFFNKRRKQLKQENRHLRKTIQALAEAVFREARAHRPTLSRTRSTGPTATRVFDGEGVVTSTQGDSHVAVNDYQPTSPWYTDSGQNDAGIKTYTTSDGTFYVYGTHGPAEAYRGLGHLDLAMTRVSRGQSPSSEHDSALSQLQQDRAAHMQALNNLRNNVQKIRQLKSRKDDLFIAWNNDLEHAKAWRKKIKQVNKKIKALEQENQRLRKTIQTLVEAAFREARRPAQHSTGSRGATVTRVVDSEGLVTYTQGNRHVALNDYLPTSLWYTDSGQSRGGQAVNHQDDPLFLSQNSWGQHTDDQWAIKRVGFLSADNPRSAWHGLSAGQPVIVALIDSGVDPTHPELAGTLWTNQKEIPGNNIDDDHNGYIDDVHGWNFLTDNTDLFDYNGHGTVNAGIIAARSDNGIGIKGINPWARIMPLKVLDPLLRGDSAAIGFAILYAVQNGARIINLSIGGTSFSRFERDAIEYAQQKAVLVVVAAGNGGTSSELNYPGSLDGVLTVAATNADNRHATFSNWGQAIDIAAPGVDILSLRAWHTDLLRWVGPDGYVPGSAIVGRTRRYYRVSGTSFATPIVSATASLIMAVQPQLSAVEVTRKILNSADDIGIPGWDQFSGYGLLNATRAMRADPEFQVRASLASLTRSSLRGKPAIVVSGTAESSDFDSARLELGAGSNPKSWRRIATPITEPVTDGPLGVIPATAFSHAGTWTIRLVLQTSHHGIRESRGQLHLN
ncbi:MAG TPA: hypothetical protein ENI62_04015 [Gammaproteobacteria bacterium]|nr:hypothetical protein [Gammaproteobacteria bacterium]